MAQIDVPVLLLVAEEEVKTVELLLVEAGFFNEGVKPVLLPDLGSQEEVEVVSVLPFEP